jgi:NAD(P)-dependent dehydrogenase (short-subunit alcohol dehydrogenase family)
MTNEAMFSLSGRQALVIGGGSGIGRAIALGLARAGADVHVAGRRPDKLDESADLIRATGRRSNVFAIDARDLDALDALVDTVRDTSGVPDILVNAQGVMSLRNAEDFTAEDYDRIMDTNLKSVWFACTRFGTAMQALGGGGIINIASMASFRGFPRNGLYCMSKHGVRALTESLAAEWAPRGIRVNAIAPGFFITDLNRGAMTDERQARALSRVPMGRFGDVDELSGAAVFLASPAASYVTGVTVPVDGGFLSMGM